MCHSLEHTNLPEKPLKEAYRILKPNGILAVSVPNMSGLYALLQLIFQGKLKYIAPDHLTAFTPKKLQKIMVENGFKLLEESGDIVYFPKLGKIRLIRKLGYWLAERIPKWAEVYILIAKKPGEKGVKLV